MKKVFLVNPLSKTAKGESIRFLRDYSGAEIPTSMVYPPLDLAYTAALLRENGAAVNLLDASTLNLSCSRVVKAAVAAEPDFIGIPSAWGSIETDIELARNLKDKLPSSKILIWGPSVTVNPQLALSSGYIDYVILGEPERTFLDILRGILDKNVAYLCDDRIVTKERSLLQDLDSLPFPARDLLPNDRYKAPYVRKNPFTTVSTSRGCPYSKCSFCPTNIWYLGQVRYRSVENVMLELEEIVRKFKIHSIIFRDQSLTSEQERLFSICDGILRMGYPLSWRCFSGAAGTNLRMFSKMKEAGCYQVNFGFESGSQEVLDLNNKCLRVEESRQAVSFAKEAGLEVSGSFMLGMWGDTQETIKKTIDFAINLDIDFAEFILATPLPTTKFYEECDIPEKINVTLWQRWYNRSFTSNLLLEDKILERHLKNAYKRFYLRPGYIFRIFCKGFSFERFFLQTKSALSLLRKIGS